MIRSNRSWDIGPTRSGIRAISYATRKSGATPAAQLFFRKADAPARHFHQDTYTQRDVAF